MMDDLATHGVVVFCSKKLSEKLSAVLKVFNDLQQNGATNKGVGSFAVRSLEVICSASR